MTSVHARLGLAVLAAVLAGVIAYVLDGPPDKVVGVRTTATPATTALQHLTVLRPFRPDGPHAQMLARPGTRDPDALFRALDARPVLFAAVRQRYAPFITIAATDRRVCIAVDQPGTPGPSVACAPTPTVARRGLATSARTTPRNRSRAGGYSTVVALVPDDAGAVRIRLTNGGDRIGPAIDNVFTGSFEHPTTKVSYTSPSNGPTTVPLARAR